MDIVSCAQSQEKTCNLLVPDLEMTTKHSNMSQTGQPKVIHFLAFKPLIRSYTLFYTVAHSQKLAIVIAAV